jgi:hypothetical protein
MNKDDVIKYIKFAEWAINSKQSVADCFKLSESIEAIMAHVENIINDSQYDGDLAKQMKQIINRDTFDNPVIKDNMKLYETTQEEAHDYETHCHSCGTSTELGQKYCNNGCQLCVEEFKYKCHWGDSCKMCHVHENYYIVTRSVVFDYKTYWIDNSKNVYNDDGAKVATEQFGELIYV